MDILDFIFSYPFFSTNQFVEKTGISKRSVNRYVTKLQESKLINISEKGTGTKPDIYAFNELLSITG
jgi:transcription initiation factor IIE alpha subunit